jgi:hypothetical protein
MSIERSATTASLTDVLDRVLDRGIMLDPWLRAAERGLRLAGLRVRTSTDPARPPARPQRRRAAPSRP